MDVIKRVKKIIVDQLGIEEEKVKEAEAKKEEIVDTQK